MQTFDWHRMLLSDLPLDFLAEVGLRVLMAYALVFIFLKLSGRRGVRQLSLFELIVILILGSAAGDVTFYEDVPMLPVVMVFIVLLSMYRLTTYFMIRFTGFGDWVEGKPVTVVREGRYEVASLRPLNVSEDEFFMELRQRGVEHLGQVRLTIVEVDGDVSVFFYEREAVKPGLSVLPPEHRKVYKQVPMDNIYACNYCGHAQMLLHAESKECPCCHQHSWSLALSCAPPR